MLVRNRTGRGPTWLIALHVGPDAFQKGTVAAISPWWLAAIQKIAQNVKLSCDLPHKGRWRFD
jgi:hypothetical protein